jgi:hypothetical protein
MNPLATAGLVAATLLLLALCVRTAARMLKAQAEPRAMAERHLADAERGYLYHMQQAEQQEAIANGHLRSMRRLELTVAPREVKATTYASGLTADERAAIGAM